ncbi:MAG: hypothetical protein V3S08_09310 [Phycisphaerales bacterium]
MYIEWSYAAYLVLSIVLTIWVAHTMHSRGRVFLVDRFGGNESLADSVNHLLVVGFYLVNIGFVTLALKSDATLANWREVIEFLSSKIGLVLLMLGGMHFINLLFLARVRHRPVFDR